MITLNSELREDVEKATVHFNGKRGRGVLVEGGYILTCVHVLAAIRNAPEFPFSDPIEEVTHGENKFAATVLYAELISDLAILGDYEGQYSKGHEEMLRTTYEIPIDTFKHRLGKQFAVAIFTQNGWQDGIATHTNLIPHRFSIITKSGAINPGDSGSPICSAIDGSVIGIINTGGGQDFVNHSIGSFLFGALPSWFKRKK